MHFLDNFQSPSDLVPNVGDTFVAGPGNLTVYETLSRGTKTVQARQKGSKAVEYFLIREFLEGRARKIV